MQGLVPHLPSPRSPKPLGHHQHTVPLTVIHQGAFGDSLMKERMDLDEWGGRNLTKSNSYGVIILGLASRRLRDEHSYFTLKKWFSLVSYFLSFVSSLGGS